ncbi:MAG: hypoxanthine phosphoribosyltransferase [Dehalococcoidales bacterium]|nr:hypoxanthine phosphoribosyltransferase [Dehalococcoidales bacterium]
MNRLSSGVVEVLLSEETIRQRVAEMGRQITDDYVGLDLVLVGVLKGAVAFMVDLARAIDLPLAMDFMAVSSYGASTESSGVVRITKDLDASLQGKHVLVVEDIVDTGLTLKYILEMLHAHNPASVRICALFDKVKERKADVHLDYVGFKIPNRFVVGYGLDYAEIYRNLPYLGVLKEVDRASEG